MTDTHRDGGPAFPQATAIDPEDGYTLHGGMSLRDWFAGQALAGALAADPDAPEGTTEQQDADAISAAAYLFADAMLKARARNEQGGG